MPPPSRAINAPNADFSITGNGEVWGSIIARNVTLNGNAAFRYDEALLDYANTTGTGQPVGHRQVARADARGRARGLHEPVQLLKRVQGGVADPAGGARAPRGLKPARSAGSTLRSTEGIAVAPAGFVLPCGTHGDFSHSFAAF